MKSITIKKEGLTFEFLCDSHNTRSGFAHDCTLYYGLQRIVRHCYYLNRTWERWSHQSVCLKCIDAMIEDRLYNLKMAYMEHNGYKRMTRERLNDYNKSVVNDLFLKILESVKTDLQKNLY